VVHAKKSEAGRFIGQKFGSVCEETTSGMAYRDSVWNENVVVERIAMAEAWGWFRNLCHWKLLPEN
jgi:hypothetical protein